MYPGRQRYWIPCFCRHVLLHSGELNLTGKWKAAFCQVAARRRITAGRKHSSCLYLGNMLLRYSCESTRLSREDSHRQRLFSFFPLATLAQAARTHTHTTRQQLICLINNAQIPFRLSTLKWQRWKEQRPRGDSTSISQWRGDFVTLSRKCRSSLSLCYSALWSP